jgi:hypothetical protein
MGSRSWFFRLAGLAFIALMTPALAVYMHGSAGFFSLLALAVLAGLMESSFRSTLQSVAALISRNKLLVALVIWYLAGFTLNMFLRGGGVDDWRLVLGPLTIMIGLFFAFGFMGNADCHRYFQIGFVLAAGVQSFFSAQVLSSSAGIAREMWFETSGAWVYGNQTAFAFYAMILPVLIWRSFRETGFLRLLLLASCLFILVTASISSFGISLGLTILGGLIVLALSVFLLRRSFWIVLFVFIMISAIGALGYQYTYDNPLFAPAYYRIENFIHDPESGGYTGVSRSASRWYLAEISIHTFQAEPLVGMGGPREYNPYIGGHSSLFDSLAIYGLLGGGGALGGIILVTLANIARRFRHQPDWETLFGLTTIMLLVVVGIVDPFWEKLIPVAIILVRPFRLLEEGSVQPDQAGTMVARTEKPAIFPRRTGLRKSLP